MSAEPPARRRFLTVSEVAALMRVSNMTVYRILRTGDLPAIRVGRSYRVPEDALEMYLANHVVEHGGGEQVG